MSKDLESIKQTLADSQRTRTELKNALIAFLRSQGEKVR